MKTLRIVILLCLVFLNNYGVNSCDDITNAPKIVIIGAGPAGIAAASKLFSNGFKNVKILEAEDRIGGRIYTTKFGEYDVDLGGQWVHGEKGNVVFELVYPLGLLEKADDPLFGLTEMYVDSLGNVLNEQISKNLSDFFFTDVYDVRLEDDSPYKSLGEYAEKSFEEKFKNIPEIIDNKSKYLQFMELLIEGSDPADSWNEISTLASQQHIMCDGDIVTNWKKKGYSTLLEVLMKRIPDPTKELPVMNNTLLNTEVTSIDYSNTSTEAPVIIKTTEGQFEADHVIVTVSLGVLKEKHNSLFVPTLPEWKVQAIEGMGFGTVAKVILLYDKPFWDLGDNKILTFNFLWNEAEKKLIESDPEKKWIVGMSSMHTVEHKPNLLLAWIAGKYAREMEELPEDKVFNHTVEHLQRFLGKRYNVTTPIGMMRTRWYSNPHFRGTYSFGSVEMTIKKKVGPVILEEPVDQNNLKILFAGEATSKDRFSFVDGAVGSGWNAADRLINHYKNSSCQNS